MLGPSQVETMEDDAWSASFKPPENESPEEKKSRAAHQQEADRVSKEIDDAIEKSREGFEKRRKAIKILLHGQAESGKSTFLRDMQSAICPASFRREMSLWKIVIQFNVIDSVKKLLAMINEELVSQSSSTRDLTVPSPILASTIPSDKAMADVELPHSAVLSNAFPSAVRVQPAFDPNADPHLTQTHVDLCRRLLPLRSVETDLVCPLPPKFGNSTFSSTSSEHTAGSTLSHLSDPTALLEMLAPHIHALWTDPIVQALIKHKGVGLEDNASFFLNDVMRISKPEWKPDLRDVMRAGPRTPGVEEHRFVAEDGSEWYIYEMGGRHGSRLQWVPYFDDVQAIIFLAPLVFDQVLEDTKVNRLENSLNLWKEVCASPLLGHTTIILILNKLDILESTLKSGVRVQTYVPSYGSIPNDTQSALRFFRSKFREIHKRLSPTSRPFYCHGTSATDAQTATNVLSSIRDSILRRYLEDAKIIN